MSETRASLEVIAPSVEEAVAKGLEELGLPENAVEVEILDPGSRGLFGLGSRQARVRLTIKNGPAVYEGPSAPAFSYARPAAAPVAAPEVELEPEELELEETELEELEFEEPELEEPERLMELDEDEQGEPVEMVGEGDENALNVARETVIELLDKMKVRANVTARYGSPDDARSKAPLIVEVRGNDLSILIGPRAETLNALQYISGLILSKELGRSIPLTVDVEGYRFRREQQIRQLARRMAEQAIKTGRRQVLEPMPASERRLIHIELRSNPNVMTESIGDEPRRKVTIVPKE